MYRYLSVAAFVSTRTPWRVPPGVTLDTSTQGGVEVGWGGVGPYPTPPHLHPTLGGGVQGDTWGHPPRGAGRYESRNR